jgi:hypothetical protein
MQTLYRLLAEKQIQIPKLTSVTRWLSLLCPIPEKDLDVKSKVLIRRATEEDIAYLTKCRETTDKNESILSMDLEFWNQHGFRCLYVGHFINNPQPCCIQYLIDESDNHRFKNMEYGGMYKLLDPETVHEEGAYVLKQHRKRRVYHEFALKRHKLLYEKGKRFLRGHGAVNESRMPMFKAAARLGSVPDYWISRVTINLRFYRASVFIHHPIKASDHGIFPLTLFESTNK